MGLRIHAVKAEDAPFIRTVTELLLRAYDGRRLRWALKDSETLWGIHPGWRAGVVGVQVGGRKCCAKFFYDHRLRAKLRNRLGFPKAGRAFRKGRELARRGVATPAMWGFAVDWASGFAVLVAELIEHADSVDHVVERVGADLALAERLGRFVRRMHEAGVAHKDLSLSNFLMQSDGAFLLVDQEDCLFFRAVPKRVRWKNLRHLNERAKPLVPRALRGAFLRSYWDVPQTGDVVPESLGNPSHRGRSGPTAGRTSTSRSDSPCSDRRETALSSRPSLSGGTCASC